MSGVTLDELRLVDELQARYADVLDRKDMDGWLAAFDGEGSYVLVTAESEQSNWSIALIMDDCRARLEDRVKFVEKVWAGTFQDYQTRHVGQRLECTRGADGLYAVRSNFLVAFTRSDTGKSELFVSGVYHDLVSMAGGKAAFRSRKAVIDAPMLPHYLVYPL